jgi:hypothetical protein
MFLPSGAIALDSHSRPEDDPSHGVAAQVAPIKLIPHFNLAIRVFSRTKRASSTLLWSPESTTKRSQRTSTVQLTTFRCLSLHRCVLLSPKLWWSKSNKKGKDVFWQSGKKIIMSQQVDVCRLGQQRAPLCSTALPLETFWRLSEPPPLSQNYLLVAAISMISLLLPTQSSGSVVSWSSFFRYLEAASCSRPKRSYVSLLILYVV